MNLAARVQVLHPNYAGAAQGTAIVWAFYEAELVSCKNTWKSALTVTKISVRARFAPIYSLLNVGSNNLNLRCYDVLDIYYPSY